MGNVQHELHQLAKRLLQPNLGSCIRGEMKDSTEIHLKTERRRARMIV